MPIPVKLAPDTILGLKPRSTYLPSAKIGERWSAEIKDHSLFSARTTNNAYLEIVQKALAQVADRGTGPVQAQEALQKALQTLGYKPDTGFWSDRHRYGSNLIPPATPGSITDLSSTGRIQLILDTNIKQARSMAQKASSEDPVFLMTNPAWRLERTGSRKVPRKDWIIRWQEAGASVDWEGALKTQFVALKSSPIWQALGDGVGDFRDAVGSDYPPFAFGSGMAWTNVRRREWKQLCEAEGVPDHLDEVDTEAQDLLDRQERGETGPGAAVGAPTGVDGRGEVGTAGTPGTAAVERPAPVPVFHPNLQAKTAAENDARTADLRAKATYQRLTDAKSAIEAARQEAEDVFKDWPEAKDDAAIKAAFDARVREVDGLMSSYLVCKQGLDTVTGRIGTMEVPTSKEEQEDFNARAGMFQKAVAGQVADLSEIGKGAASAATQAKAEVVTFRNKLKNWMIVECDRIRTMDATAKDDADNGWYEDLVKQVGDARKESNRRIKDAEKKAKKGK